jgi:hypothetical protein
MFVRHSHDILILLVNVQHLRTVLVHLLRHRPQNLKTNSRLLVKGQSTLGNVLQHRPRKDVTVPKPEETPHLLFNLERGRKNAIGQDISAQFNHPHFLRLLPNKHFPIVIDAPVKESHQIHKTQMEFTETN